MRVGRTTRRMLDLVLILVFVGAIGTAVLTSLASWNTTGDPVPAPRVRATVRQPVNVSIPGPTAPPETG
jgi:hypothetical protein